MVFGIFLIFIILILIAGTVPRLFTSWFAESRVYNLENVPLKRVAIIFGAGLRRDGSPSPVLRDRVAIAAELYHSGKVEKLLMSGDNSSPGHNEPAAMLDFAIDLGVPKEDIVLDYAGRRTYDTCFRARDIFHVDSATLITQSFHLPRALYICNALGVPAIGVPADQRQYHRSSLVFWNLREAVATAVALWEVHITQPRPILGNPEPIFPQEAQ